MLSLRKLTSIISASFLLGIGSFNVVSAATINSSRSASYFQNSGINSGLIGWWTFDGKDALTDKSGQNQNGTNYGADVTSGRIGQAMSFNGSSDYISFGANALYALANDVSVSAWVYVTDMDASRRGPIVSKRHGYSIYAAGGNGTMSYLCYEGYTDSGWGNNFCSSSRVLTKNRWHHVALSFKANTYDALYVDGVLVGNGVPVGGHSGYYENLLVGWGGSGEWGTPPYFAGKIDDVRVYNRAISIAEVKQLYALGSSATINKTIGAQSYNQGQGINRGLVGWWTLDGKDISGTAAYDKSGLGKNGAITGTTKVAGKLGQALRFAANEYILVDDSAGTYNFGTGSYTITAWIKPTIPDTYQVVLGKGSHPSNVSWRAFINASNRLQLFWGSDGQPYDQSSFPITMNKWQFVVWGVDAGSAKVIYAVNSSYEAIGVTVQSVTTPNNLVIGSDAGGLYDFLGYVDDIRVYSRALSSSEIKQLYAMGSSATINKTIGTASYQQGQGINSGLIGWWTFDGKDIYSTNAYDKSVKNRTATIATGATKTIGKIGQGLRLDGSAGYTTAGGFTELGTTNQPYSIAGWLKIAPGETDGNVVHISSQSGGGGWCIPFVSLSSSKITANSWNGGIVSAADSVNATTNKWYQFATTWDSTNGLRLFVNGALANSATQAIYSASGESDYVHTGLNPGGCAANAGWFNGWVDDIRVYERAISPTEVQQLYQAGK